MCSHDGASPADLHLVAQVHGLQGGRARLEVADVEVGQRVIDEAVHGAVRAVHVLVDQPRDEVRRKGDDEGLKVHRNAYVMIYYTVSL